MEWLSVQLIQGNGCGAKMPETIIKSVWCDLNLVLSESGENYDWGVIRARTKPSAAEKTADAKLKASLFTDDSDRSSSSENCSLEMETTIMLNFMWKWENREQEPQYCRSSPGGPASWDDICILV